MTSAESFQEKDVLTLRHQFRASGELLIALRTLLREKDQIAPIRIFSSKRVVLAHEFSKAPHVMRARSVAAERLRNFEHPLYLDGEVKIRHAPGSKMAYVALKPENPAIFTDLVDTMKDIPDLEPQPEPFNHFYIMPMVASALKRKTLDSALDGFQERVRSVDASHLMYLTPNGIDVAFETKLVPATESSTPQGRLRDAS